MTDISSSQSKMPARTSRLDTFAPPEPSPALIKALAPVNRWLFLRGIPGARSLPYVGRIPGVRGIADIIRAEVPDADAERLVAAVRPDTAAFLTPNHPEFFTDWMIDKELTTRVSPLAACWATHTVVNGMGPLVQKFWLKNNLIAQIPGAGGAAGREYSIEWALKGHGVLLHPEGQVGWHADWVAPVFPGAIEMAAEAAERAARAGAPRRALVVPVVWKLKFTHDVARGLAREMAYVEERLKLPRPQPGSPVSERIAAAYGELLARDEARWLPGASTSGGYGARQERLLAALAERLHARIPGLADAGAGIGDVLRAAERWARATVNAGSEHLGEVRRMIADARRLMRFRPALYPRPHLTQEDLAENIKRLRNDYCSGSLRDTMNRFVPQPVGPRIAHVRIAEPIDVSAALAGRERLPREEALALADELRRRLQASLDAINRGLEAQGQFRTEHNVLGV